MISAIKITGTPREVFDGVLCIDGLNNISGLSVGLLRDVLAYGNEEAIRSAINKICPTTDENGEALGIKYEVVNFCQENGFAVCFINSAMLEAYLWTDPSAKLLVAYVDYKRDVATAVKMMIRWADGLGVFTTVTFGGQDMPLGDALMNVLAMHMSQRKT